MSLRPKTKRRLLQLTGGGAVVFALGAAGVAVQLHRHEAARQQVRADGMGAFGRGDYRRARTELQKYLNDNRVDPDAIYTLAVARTRVPLPEQAHLAAARLLLVRYLELRPGDRNAQHLLLDVYQRLQFRFEALSLADVLLAGDPDDPAALSAKWQELAREGRLGAALDAATRLNAADPTDVVAQEATLELMVRLHRPPADGVARADRLVAAHPADPRFELVRAVAALLSGDPAGTRQWLAAAAARPSPDPAFTLTLAGALDRTGQWPQAVDLLDRAAGPEAPPALRAAAVERLWYAGRCEHALARLGDVLPTDPRADARLLALKALLLDGAAAPTDAMCVTAMAPATTDVAAAAAIRTVLAARTADPAAAAGSALVRATDPAHPLDARQAVSLAIAAAHDAPDSAPARFFLGRPYLRLGETGLAMEMFAQANVLAPAWAAPRLALAEALLDADQPTAAEAPARAAADRDPASTAARAALAVIAYRTLSPRAAGPDLAAVLTEARAATAAAPADPRLPAAVVDLLARQDPRSTAARTAALAFIDRPTTTPAQLYRLAAVATAHHLDLAPAIADRATALPTDTPDAAYDLAMALATAGHGDRGLRLLADRPAPDWQAADLRYREATAPAAPLTDAWAALADANPADLSVQRAVLRSAAAGRSRPLIDRTIDRLHALTGDDAVAWRLARARFQLDDPAAGRAAADAVASSMAEVTRVVPHSAEPQVLWATALERAGDPAAAAGRLRTAVQLAPDDVALPLRLAHLLARTGQFRPAADAVDPLADRASDLPPAVAADVADVYRDAGLPGRARDVLAAADAGKAVDPARAIALAQAQAAAGDPSAATRTFDQVNASPAATVDSVRAAAWFHAAAGDVSRGRAILDRLSTLAGVSAVQRGVIAGQFDGAFGDPSVARAELESVARSAPDDPRPWAALAGFDLHAGQVAAAVTAADRGLALAPADAALSALRARAQTLSSLHLRASAEPLLDALAVDPINPAAVATLDALAAAAPEPALALVAQRYPTFVPAQALAVEPLLSAGRFDAAAALAARAAQAAPSDPAPQRLLSDVWMAAGRPDQAIVAAQAWRARSLAAPQPADVAIATAHLRLGRPDRTVTQLAPYLTAGTATESTIQTYARGLSAGGRTAEADALLRPLATASSPWRQAWLSIIADTAPTAADADRRITAVAPLLAAGSVPDRVAVASAWCTVGGRFADADASRRGLAGLESLSDVADVPVDVSVLAGALHQQLGELPEAEADYRRAATARPERPRTLNNLAWVITLRGGDLAEARRLADRAATLVPADADLRLTVGQVALRQADMPAAAEAFRTAARLSPRSAAAWAGLADAEGRAGHTGDAAAAVDRAEQLLSADDAPPPSPDTAAELQRARAALGRPAGGAARTVRPVG